MSGLKEFEFQSPVLGGSIIKITRSTDGFIAKTTFDYIEYVSNPLCEGLLSSMSLDQFAELHDKFANSVKVEKDRILLTYNVGFLGMYFTFFMDKEILTPAKEALIKYKELSAVVQKLQTEVAELKDRLTPKKEALTTVVRKLQDEIAELKAVQQPHIIKFWYSNEKGMYLEIADDIRDQFAKLMRTFLHGSVYPNHNLSDHSTPWQMHYKNVEDMLADINEFYYDVSGSIKQYTDILRALMMYKDSHTDHMIPYSLFINKLTEEPKFHGSEHPYKTICSKLRMKTIQIAEVHMYKLPTFKPYSTDREFAQYAKDFQLYKVLPDKVYFNMFGVYYNPNYQVSGCTSVWNEDKKKVYYCKVIWNTGA